MRESFQRLLKAANDVVCMDRIKADLKWIDENDVEYAQQAYQDALMEYTHDLVARRVAWNRMGREAILAQPSPLGLTERDETEVLP